MAFLMLLYSTDSLQTDKAEKAPAHQLQAVPLLQSDWKKKANVLPT